MKGGFSEPGSAILVYSIRLLKFECDCFLTQNAFWGSGNGSSFGPNDQSSNLINLAEWVKKGPNSTRPAQIWPYACVPDVNCSKPSREGRASVCNRAVERRFRAISAADLRIGDSDFGAVKVRFLERHRTAPKPVVLVDSPPYLLTGDGRKNSTTMQSNEHRLF
jgi:hypothetical protein